jgi:enamine deaminase RidA (YjgF/YER057c/UK114 family)
MALKCINANGLPAPLTYSRVVIASGSRLVFVSGQVAEDTRGNPIGAGDMTLQAPVRCLPTRWPSFPEVEHRIYPH